MVKWYAICNPNTKEPISFATDDSQGFNLTELQNRFGLDNIVEITHQPTQDEVYNKKTKQIEIKKPLNASN